MAYIKDLNIDVTCFLTQKGKELYLLGDNSDILITHFTLGDSDNNYQLSANDNTLTSGFIPALSGEYNECQPTTSNGISIKSLIEFKPKGKILNQYCKSDKTLVQTFQSPDGVLYDILTKNSILCGFNYKSNPIKKTFTPIINVTEPQDDGSSQDLQYQRYVINQYTVSFPYGYKTSTISQTDADDKALQEMNNTGQSIANANGTVTFYSSGRNKNNISYTQNTAIYPLVYPNVNLTYLPELFTSNTFNDNNIKINNYVTNSYQNITNNILSNTTPIQPQTLAIPTTYPYNTGNLNDVTATYNSHLPTNTQVELLIKITNFTTANLNPNYFVLLYSKSLFNNSIGYPTIKEIVLGNSNDLISNISHSVLTETQITSLSSGQKFNNETIKLTKTQLYNTLTDINSNGYGVYDRVLVDFKLNQYRLLPSNTYDMMIVRFETPIINNVQTSLLRKQLTFTYPSITPLNYKVIDTNNNYQKI